MEGLGLFHGKATCGKCHRLFDQGGEIGPDLTPYNRTDAARMLLALVNPSAEVREGYEVFTVLTDDGRVLSGFKVDETDKVFVIRGGDGQTQTIAKARSKKSRPAGRRSCPRGC